MVSKHVRYFFWTEAVRLIIDVFANIQEATQMNPQTLETAINRAMAHPSTDRLLPPSEAKVLIGCGTTKLYELIGNGSIVAVKLGRHTRIRESSVAAFITGLPRAAIGKPAA